MYLIDTCVLAEARRRAPQAEAGMRSAPRGQTFLSVMTLGEIEKGVALRARKDKAAAASLSRWLDGVRQRFAGPSMTPWRLNGAGCRRSARVLSPTP